RRLVALNEMSEPGQGECSWDQQQGDDPVKPDDDQGRKSDRNCNKMQCAIYRMIVCAVVMRVQTHSSLASRQDYSATGGEIKRSKTSLESKRPRAVSRRFAPSLTDRPARVSSEILPSRAATLPDPKVFAISSKLTPEVVLRPRKKLSCSEP